MKISLDINGLPRTERSNARHAAILNMAVAISASEGLEALTIGRLANCLNMSRSGIFSHFGSKEDLQLKVLDWAYQLFDNEVISPAYEKPPGMLQVKNFLEGLFRYHSENCFLTHVSGEFDSREGEVKQKIVDIHRRLLEHLKKMLRTAMNDGQINQIPDEELEQLVLAVLSAFMGSQILYQLQVVSSVAAMRHNHLKYLFSALLTAKTPQEVRNWLG